MLKKFVLAAATATIFATSFGAIATPASAASITVGINAPHKMHPTNDCRRVVRNVKWYDRHGHPHWRQVVKIRCGYAGHHPHPYWAH